MEALIMFRDDVGEIVVNLTDVAEWQGYGFATMADVEAAQAAADAEAKAKADADAAKKPAK